MLCPCFKGLKVQQLCSRQQPHQALALPNDHLTHRPMVFRMAAVAVHGQVVRHDAPLPQCPQLRNFSADRQLPAHPGQLLAIGPRQLLVLVVQLWRQLCCIQSTMKCKPFALLAFSKLRFVCSVLSRQSRSISSHSSSCPV